MESVFPHLLYLLICAINRHLSEAGGGDAFNVLNKADKRQVNCYGASVQKIKLGSKSYHFITTGSRRFVKF